MRTSRPLREPLLKAKLPRSSELARSSVSVNERGLATSTGEGHKMRKRKGPHGAFDGGCFNLIPGTVRSGIVSSNSWVDRWFFTAHTCKAKHHSGSAPPGKCSAVDVTRPSMAHTFGRPRACSLRRSRRGVQHSRKRCRCAAQEGVGGEGAAHGRGCSGRRPTENRGDRVFISRCFRTICSLN